MPFLWGERTLDLVLDLGRVEASDLFLVIERDDVRYLPFFVDDKNVNRPGSQVTQGSGAEDVRKCRSLLF